MRNFRLLLFCAIVFPSGAVSAEKEIEAGTLMSHFVWRGLRLSEGPVFQSSGTIASRGFLVNVWGNFDLDAGKLSETDVTVSYSHEYKKFSLETGLIHYGIFDGHDSDELYADIASNGLLQPSVKAFFDVNAGRGAFLQVSAGHGIPVSQRFSLDLKASVGVVFHNSFMGLPDSGREFTGLHNAEILAAFLMNLGKGWEIKLQAGASAPLSRRSRQAIVNGSVCKPGHNFCNGTIVYGGATVTCAF